MKPISINLASRPFYNRTLYLVMYSVSLALLLGITGLNIYSFTADQIALGKLMDARLGLDNQLLRLVQEERRIAGDAERYQLIRFNQQNQFANRVMLQRYFSWTQLFNHLESVQPASVKLASIRPSVRSDSILIRVVGVAKNPGAFTEFEESLIRSPYFADVYPVSESLDKARRGVKFDLNFRYMPGVDGEEAGQDAAGEADAPAGEEPAGPVDTAAVEASEGTEVGSR